MAAQPLESIPRVAEVTWVRGADAHPDDPPSLFIEMPHGATRAGHFDALAAELDGPFPDDLREFFFVNTDVGAPEVGARLAAHLTAAHPTRTVLLVRSLVPRTFVDCNRMIDPDAAPRASAAGEVTPGLAPYVTTAHDVALLLARYGAYRRLAEAACAATCGAEGLTLMLHTYAPRTVQVPVDERIVERLRAAYRPDVYETWTLRPEVDLIVRGVDGRLRASEPLLEEIEAVLDREDVEHARSATYPLHPSTLAHHLADRWPNQTLCLEIRRDLLARRFTPFAEMDVAEAKADRFGRLLAEPLSTCWLR